MWNKKRQFIASEQLQCITRTVCTMYKNIEQIYHQLWRWAKTHGRFEIRMRGKEGRKRRIYDSAISWNHCISCQFVTLLLKVYVCVHMHREVNGWYSPPLVVRNWSNYTIPPTSLQISHKHSYSQLDSLQGTESEDEERKTSLCRSASQCL